MGVKNPSDKGGAFERLCGRELSLYLTDGVDETQLIRSVSSGGWKRRRVRQVGDLAPNGPAGEDFRSVFGVECKRRQEFEWRHLWTSDSPALLAWWTKHRGECEEAGLVPMLLYRRNYQPTLIGLPPDLTDWPAPTVLTIESGDERLRLTEWDAFVEIVTPETLMEAGRAWLDRRSCT